MAKWAKGQSGNPGGRPKLPEHLRNVERIHADEIKAMISRFSRMRVSDLKAYLKDPEVTGIEQQLISNILNPLSIGFVLDRTIGKEPDKVETKIGHLENPEEYEEIPKEALIQLVSGGEK